MIAHTPGPWRWEVNMRSKSLHLAGGKPQFDLTIIEPTRWGMGSATLMIRDTAHDGMNIMHKLHERHDWWDAFPGRGHHADWCAAVTHPDMRLIEAAPCLLAALKALIAVAPAKAPGAGLIVGIEEKHKAAIAAARAAIAKAEGSQS